MVRFCSSSCQPDGSRFISNCYCGKGYLPAKWGKTPPESIMQLLLSLWHADREAAPPPKVFRHNFLITKIANEKCCTPNGRSSKFCLLYLLQDSKQQDPVEPIHHWFLWWFAKPKMQARHQSCGSAVLNILLALWVARVQAGTLVWRWSWKR